jgi:hypothetical protein
MMAHGVPDAREAAHDTRTDHGGLSTLLRVQGADVASQYRPQLTRREYLALTKE